MIERAAESRLAHLVPFQTIVATIFSSESEASTYGTDNTEVSQELRGKTDQSLEEERGKTDEFLEYKSQRWKKRQMTPSG